MFLPFRGKRSLISVVLFLFLALVFCGCTSDPALTESSSAKTTPSTTNESTTGTIKKIPTVDSSNSGTFSTDSDSTMVDLNGNEIVSKTPTSTSQNSSNANSSTGQGVSLNVPLRNQLDPANGVLREVACGATSLAMVLQFAGINVPTPTLMVACNVRANYGCDQKDMIRAGKTYSPNAQIFSGKDTNWVKEQLNGGKPVIVGIPGHYMVCIGYDAQGNFLFNDPYGGKRLTLSPAEFANQFEGDAMTV